MKNTSSLAAMFALLGLLTVGACAGGEDATSGPSGATACAALRACCEKMDDASKDVCLQSVDAQQSAANAEQWCQAAVDSYEQVGICGEGGTGGSSGTGGTSGTGGSGTGGSSGTGGTGGSGGIGGSGGAGGSGGVGGSGGIGGSGGSSTCIHDECTTGDALDSSCSTCAAAVCSADAFCCDNSWNSYCVDGAKNLCGLCGGTGGTGGTGGGTCVHDECTTGDALDSSCSTCAAMVCTDDPYCCNNSWNSYCVDGAKSLCGMCGGTGGSGGGGSCSHDECTTGDALDSSCSTCVATVCTSDPYCCNNSWNSYCVDGAKSLCGLCG